MIRRARAGAVVLTSLAAVALAAPAAQAHSLESSTVSVHLTSASGSTGSAEVTGVDADLSIAVETLQTALGLPVDGTLDDAEIAEATQYVADHLAVTDATGQSLSETLGDVRVEAVEGIESLRVHVDLDATDADLSTLTLDYDAVIEAVSGHEAVVVLTDTAGEVTTAGVLTAQDSTLTLVEDAASAGAGSGAWDLVGLGFHHVLAGADHLLFLLTLLLTAPLVAVAGRWRADPGRRTSVHGVLRVVTAFTLGHSLTLIAAARGWVDLPTTPVEVLVAASVAVAAIHALRPLAPRGEAWIAAGFGLVHGCAFAGILADLGLSGRTSVLDLLAFNVGVELAQLAVVAALFPSLVLALTSRAGGVVRVVVASLALALSGGWVLDRLGLLASPFDGLEAAAIGHPWLVALGVAVLGTTCRLVDRARPPTTPAGSTSRAAAGSTQRG